MGPQPFGCGRIQGAHAGGRRHAASMGPQPFGCGRAGRRVLLNANVSFNGAATFRLRKAASARGFDESCAGFNGAATFRLRKVPRPNQL